MLPACPDRDTLRQYVLGLILDPDARALDDHLLKCPLCVRQLGGLTEDDDLVRQVRLREAAPQPHSGTLDQLRQRLAALPLPDLIGSDSACDIVTPPDPKATDIGGLKAPFAPTPLLGGEIPGAVTGHRLEERYLLEQELGHGGMGQVYRGRDCLLDRPVAVKVLLEQHGGKPDRAQRFREEARLTGQLQHPGIPPVHEVGVVADGRPFFALKLVQGRTLAELLGERPGAADDLARWLGVFETVCQTLGYAHSRGVIHRDLKPSNVMVGSFGEVQVMDWGLARVLASDGSKEEEAGPARAETVWGGLTRLGEAVGTPAYMPPEQARGERERVDQRSDVFGLGAILCEILTGRPPFRGRDGEEAFARAQACDHAEALTELAGCGADEELVRLARVCLAARPEDRPADAGAVAAAVAGWRAGVQQRLRAAELERAAFQARAEEAVATAAAERRARRRTAGLAVALLLIGLAGGGTGLWWFWQRAELLRTGEQDLGEVRAHLVGWRTGEAEKALVRAELRLANGGPAGLVGRVKELRESLELMGDLDQIRLKKATLVDGKFDYASAAEGYATLFQKRGLAKDREDPEAVAGRIQGSPIRAQLVAALDDWAVTTADQTRWSWLLEVAREADPGAWGDKFRDGAVWGKKEALEELAQHAPVDKLTPQLLVALGEALSRRGGDPVPLLTKAQQWHPTDFWLNFLLGYALQQGYKPNTVQSNI